MTGPEADYGNAREAAKSRSYSKTVPNKVAAGKFAPIVFETTGCMSAKAKDLFDTL